MNNLIISKLQLMMLLLTVANLLNGFYNSLAIGFGFSYPYTSFLPLNNDLFADLIKTALSLPGKAIISTSNWAPIYLDYLNNNPYGGVDALKVGSLSNLHGMPLPTMIGLLVRNLLAEIEPTLVVAIFIVPILFSYGFLVYKFGGKNRLILLVALFSSYPIVFAISRAHFGALMLAILLIVYLLQVHNSRFMVFSALILALAVNFRPNALIFLIVPMLLCRGECLFKFLLKFCVLSILIFTAALIFCNKYYPDYTIANFLKAVEVYRNIYMHQDAGLTFGSSFYGGLRLIDIVFKLQLNGRFIDGVTSILFFASMTVIYLLNGSKKINRFDLIFATLCMYSLFTGTFADYHLIVFFVVFLIIPNSPNSNFNNTHVLNVQIAAGVLIMAAKNYIFIDDSISIQVLINPLIISSALIFTLMHCYRNNTGSEVF